MSNSKIEQERMLKRVANTFGSHRRRNHGRASYSKPLKDLALSAVESGLAADAVSQAAGISPQSLTNWQRSLEARVRPRELRLEENVSAGSTMNAAFDQLPQARIRLCSGVSIEVPVSAVTASLIAALSANSVSTGGAL